MTINPHNPVRDDDRDAAGPARPSAAACRDFNGLWWEPYYSHRTEGDGTCVFDGEAWPCTAERDAP